MRLFLWFSNTVINVRNAGLHCSSSCIRNNLFRSFFYLACLLDFLGVFFPSSMKCLKRGVTLFVFAKWTTLHDERGAQDNEQGLKGTPIHFRENKKYCRWRFLLILNLPFIYHFKNSVLLKTQFHWELNFAANSVLPRTQFCWELNFAENSVLLRTHFC